MLNKYDVWIFNSRILLAYDDRSKALTFLRVQLHIGVYRAERKHWSLWPIFYVDTTTNQNIPRKSCVLFVPLYALDTNMNRTHHQTLSPCSLFWFVRNEEYAILHYVYTTVVRVRELNLKTSYLFDINCHFHALFVISLKINVHFKPFFVQPWIPL